MFIQAALWVACFCWCRQESGTTPKKRMLYWRRGFKLFNFAAFYCVTPKFGEILRRRRIIIVYICTS